MNQPEYFELKQNHPNQQPISNTSLSELDQHFHLFRESIQQQPNNQPLLLQLKHQLISTIQQITNNNQTYFPLKLERKRSRQRSDNEQTNHHPKAARADGSINSTAGLLSRRSSQIAITPPSINSTPNGLISDLVGIPPDLLSPPITYSDPSSTNQSQFSTNLNHNFHPLQPTRRTPADSPNPSQPNNHPPHSHPHPHHHQYHHHQHHHQHHHHHPPTCYSASETPLISPHELASKNPNETSFQTISSPPLNEPPHGNLTTTNQVKHGGKSEILHLQLSGIISDLTYQQQQLSDPQTNLSAGSTDIPITGNSTLNSPKLLQSVDDQLHLLPSDRPGKFTFTLPSQSSPPIITENTRLRPSRPMVRPHSKSFTSARILGSDLHSCPRLASDSKISQTSYTFSSPSLLPDGTQIDLSSLPGTLSGLSTTSSTIGLELSQDEIMQDGMITDPLPIQPETLPSSEQISNPPIDRPPTTRSRAQTIESQRPSPDAGCPAGDAEISTTIEHTPMDTVDPSTHPVLGPPLHSPSDMPPPAPEPSLIVSSSSISVPAHPDDHAQIINPPTRVPSPPVNRQMGAASAGVSPHLAAELEPIFNRWLGRLCSDLEMKDSKGEPIHQTLMARKMQRLEESADFRPFKFRIQAFTNSFFEELVRNGFQEKDLPMKKVRQYLWSQSCISRFNEEGKKAKSKGNHVWHIEAKKMMNGQWSFLHFQRKIMGNPPSEAHAGIKWTWAAKVWDPQCSAQNIKASFSSPDLPTWLSWRGNLLTGVPTLDLIGRSYHITVRATSNHNSKPSSLDFSFNLTVKSPEELITNRKNRNAEENHSTQSDSNVPQSSSEQISLDNTPTHSPPDLAALTSGSSSAFDPVPNSMLLSERQVPGLSRTDSSESVPISSPSLEDPPRMGRAGLDRILTENSLMHDLRAAVFKEGENLDFDTAHAAEVLNRMMSSTPTTTTTTTSEAVAEALGKLTDNNTHQATSLAAAQSQSIDLSSSAHPLALHLNQQIGLTAQRPAALMGVSGEGQMTTGLLMLPSNGGMVTSELEGESSSGETTGLGHALERAGLTEPGGILLDQIISPSQLMSGPMEIKSTADSTLALGAVVHHHQQQQAVALHQARLQTVRENLMSPDVFVSDSAGNLIRTAIVSDDPVARQFAADVLAPMTATNPSTSSITATTTTLTGSSTDPSLLPLATANAPITTTTTTTTNATNSSASLSLPAPLLSSSDITPQNPNPLPSSQTKTSSLNFDVHNNRSEILLQSTTTLQPVLLLPLTNLQPPPPPPPDTAVNYIPGGTGTTGLSSST